MRRMGEGFDDNPNLGKVPCYCPHCKKYVTRVAWHQERNIVITCDTPLRDWRYEDGAYIYENEWHTCLECGKEVTYGTTPELPGKRRRS